MLRNLIFGLYWSRNIVEEEVGELETENNNITVLQAPLSEDQRTFLLERDACRLDDLKNTERTSRFNDNRFLGPGLIDSNMSVDNERDANYLNEVHFDLDVAFYQVTAMTGSARRSNAARVDSTPVITDIVNLVHSREVCFEMDKFRRAALELVNVCLEMVNVCLELVNVYL